MKPHKETKLDNAASSESRLDFLQKAIWEHQWQLGTFEGGKFIASDDGTIKLVPEIIAIIWDEIQKKSPFQNIEVSIQTIFENAIREKRIKRGDDIAEFYTLVTKLFDNQDIAKEYVAWQEKNKVDPEKQKLTYEAIFNRFVEARKKVAVSISEIQRILLAMSEAKDPQISKLDHDFLLTTIKYMQSATSRDEFERYFNSFVSVMERATMNNPEAAYLREQVRNYKTAQDILFTSLDFQYGKLDSALYKSIAWESIPLLGPIASAVKGVSAGAEAAAAIPLEQLVGQLAKAGLAGTHLYDAIKDTEDPNDYALMLTPRELAMAGVEKYVKENKAELLLSGAAIISLALLPPLGILLLAGRGALLVNKHMDAAIERFGESESIEARLDNFTRLSLTHTVRDLEQNVRIRNVGGMLAGFVETFQEAIAGKSSSETTLLAFKDSPAMIDFIGGHTLKAVEIIVGDLKNREPKEVGEVLLSLDKLKKILEKHYKHEPEAIDFLNKQIREANKFSSSATIKPLQKKEPPSQEQEIKAAPIKRLGS